MILKFLKEQKALYKSPKIIVEFLRKNRSFNKSRYSRNRQLARVIFYFALYINILIIYGIFYFIYGLSIYHGSLYFAVYSLYASFIVSFFFRMSAI